MFLRVSFLVSFFAVFCPAMGQPLQKAALDSKDYDLWHTTYIDNVSDNGKWVSYRLSRKDGKDTLVVIDDNAKHRYPIPRGKTGKFGRDFFVCGLPDDKALIISLTSGKQQIFEKVFAYSTLQQGKLLLLLQDSLSEPSKKLHIFNSKGRTIHIIRDIADYRATPDGRVIIYTSVGTSLDSVRSAVFTYEIATGSASKIFTGTAPIKGLALSSDGTRCAFYEDNSKDGLVWLADLKQNSKSSISLGSDARLADDLPIRFSDDGEKIFFGILSGKPLGDNTKQDVPEVWRACDPQIYPIRKILENRQWTKLCVWETPSKRFHEISTDQTPVFSLSGKENFAVLAPYSATGQDGRFFGKTNIRIRSLSSGKDTLLLKDHSSDEHKLRLSPVRDMLAYYRNKHWWCYDMVADKTINLTHNIDTHWDNVTDLSATQPSVYGNPAWTSDGKYILLYDNYDIWKIACDGSSAVRLTKGKEKGISFTIDESSLNFRQDRYQYYHSASPGIDLSKPVLLHGKGNDNRNGLFLLTHNEVRQIINGFFTIDQLHHLNPGQYIYRKQSFATAPSIINYDSNSGNENILVRSNSQQDKYLWGSAESIHYKSEDGDDLKAALLYPAGYKAGQKYPMVVQIYQTKSREINQYINPSLANYEGFNVTNYTLEGYVVLLPDIAYKMGDPCTSANNCVQAAIDAVIEMGIVDKTKIGLIGHSFGGYEVNCILGMNNNFAAAVSGAGVSDSTGKYFSTNTQLLGTEAWRFENQQYHMEKSFYDSKEKYIRNSPIFNADRIDTPLLLWAGKEDITVLPGQTTAMYHALRRLKKECIMLLYPGEEHSLLNEKKQLDLTVKIRQWFDYYLKDSPVANWMIQ